MTLNAIFIVGTGRSGTHFLARTMAGFSNVWDPNEGRENLALLKAVARAAIHHKPWPKSACNYYTDQIANRPKGTVFLDQHHPNIFFAEEILERFPHSILLFPSRPTEQVVASMLKHRGVLRWYKYATRLHLLGPVPFPNRFLGLLRKSEIKSEPLHLLCAKRVRAHIAEFERLRTLHGMRVRAISYEALVMNQEKELQRVFQPDEAMALGEFRSKEKPVPESLQKFEQVLSAEQVAEIRSLESVNETDRPSP